MPHPIYIGFTVVGIVLLVAVAKFSYPTDTPKEQLSSRKTLLLCLGLLAGIVFLVVGAVNAL